MARPRKIQEVPSTSTTSAKIVEDFAGDINFDDEVPVFEEDEETFSEEDIASIANVTAAAEAIVKEAKIITSNNVEDSSISDLLDNFRGELEWAITAVVTKEFSSILTKINELSNKVDKLIIDQSSIVGNLQVISSGLSDGFEEVTSLLTSTTSTKTSSSNTTTSSYVDPPNDSVVSTVRNLICKLESKKVYPADKVASTIANKIGSDAKQVFNILVSQTDLVRVVENKLHVV